MGNNPPIVLLDACVLYPYTLRDTLMHLALVDLYRPRWSERIQQEWMINLLESKDSNYTREKLQRTIDLMNNAFELACVDEGLFINLIPTLRLKDSNDRHVLAAAIAAKADYLVTSNLKDFPSKEVASYGVCVISPDEFIVDLVRENEERVMVALQSQSRSMKKWPKTTLQIIETFGKLGLKKSCDLLTSIHENYQ